MNEKFHLASKLLQVSMFSKKPHFMSQILCFVEAIPKEKSSVSSCISLKLMLSKGLIKHVSPGIFILMPLAVRSVAKLCNLVDIMMHKINGQKVTFPTLIPEALMRTSGRWEGNDNLFKLQDRHSSSFCLGATHEEVATYLLSHERLTYKSLPLCIYQITSKFRDELNPKLGLLRGKEFLMKDMYTFDSTEENAQLTYKAVCNTYDEFFQILGIDTVKVKGSSGDIGGKSSHEFHLISDVGEDEIFYCPKCKTGINKELHDGNDVICESCKVHTKRSKAIEVGHAFLLGTTYSCPFQAKFNSSKNTLETFQMGCYGLGLTRILAASVEYLSKNNSIRWPFLLSPYYVSVIPPKKGSKEESVTPFANHLAESLSKVSWLNSNVVVDDRTNLTIGKRLQEASSLGIPYVVIVSKRAQEDIPRLEVIDVYNDQTSFLSHKDTVSYFRDKNL
ncbi:putative proline--tRNA ligase, mitochondrial [Araneus ventricosus]|uniref:proline--tRNA ligase n=1 Tax=Araneus ventricosus TaxID=182803 RepID=A0A4Y2R875_ARAVE|nr:putative proline--tRNA ligase, mitochondrial [Araneus ventricosus]